MNTERKLPAKQETFRQLTTIVEGIIGILDSSPTAFVFFVSSKINHESRIIIGDTALTTNKAKQEKLTELGTKIKKLEIAFAVVCSSGNITNRNCYSLPTNQISSIAYAILEKAPNKAFGQLDMLYTRARVIVSHGSTNNVLLTFTIKNQA